MEKTASGIWDKHPGSATLPSIIIILMIQVGNVDVLKLLKIKMV
jgi:hypothetical protein